jgi:phosphatidate cytidylyltransferase
MPLSNLALRSITGAIFGTVVIGSILWHPYAQMLVFSIFMVIGLAEFYRLFKNHPVVQVSSEIGIFIGCFIYVLLIGLSLANLPIIVITILFPLFFTLILNELWAKKEHPLINISVLVFGIVYVVIPFYLSIDLSLRNTSYLPHVVGMFLLIWTNDSFAYFSGRLFGKHKLFPSVSPKKTWEGFIGGTIGAAITMLVIIYFRNGGTIETYVLMAIISVFVSFFATLGDLFESKLKRAAEVKDSGVILPGHGGILDRIDAMLFAVPVLYVFLTTIFI